MGSKINLKARIERHSRVLQHSLYSGVRRKGRKSISVVSLLAIVFFPVYPSFASFVNQTTETDFYRGDIDESSIISSYFGDTNTVGDGDVFIQSKDSYLYVNTGINEDGRDVSTSREIINYEVQSGESVASIASKFNISKDSIYWANNFDANHVIHPGDTIKVPPVSGLIHQVKSGETISGLASKYKVSEEDIMRQNLLLSGSDLKIGDTIVIPGAIKEEPKPVVKETQKTTNKPGKTNNSKKSGKASAPSAGQTEYVNSTGSFTFKWRQPFSGVWGNCTWYVASYTDVDWRGNANQWLKNAAAKGHATGQTPKVGSIVQFSGRGYNPYYGHVGIVVDVTSSHIIVSDMNYRRLGEVTTRKVAIGDSTIDGYIYMN